MDITPDNARRSILNLRVRAEEQGISPETKAQRLEEAAALAKRFPDEAAKLAGHFPEYAPAKPVPDTIPA